MAILDINGDGVVNYSNLGLDRVFYYPMAGDQTTSGDKPVVGDWNGDGRSKIGVFRHDGAWFLDANGDGVLNTGDLIFQYSSVPGDLPVVGDWNGSGTTKTGVYRNGAWLIDKNGNLSIEDTGIPATDELFQYTLTDGDVPVIGDWDGNGTTTTGIYRSTGGSCQCPGAWLLDANGDGQLSNYNLPGGDRVFQYTATFGDIPLAGKWSGTGATNTGIFRAGLWILDYDGNGSVNYPPANPAPDHVYQYTSTAGDLPVVGDWDGAGPVRTGIFRGQWILNVSGDGIMNWDNLGVNRVYQYTESAGDIPVTGKWQDRPSLFADFRTCLGGALPECYLPSGTYEVSQTLLIGRTNLTVRGGSANRKQTKLVRQQEFTGPILRVRGSASSLNSAILQDFTVCGGSRLNDSYGPNPAGCPRPSAPTKCEREVASFQCVDLEVDNVQGLNWNNVNPFTNTDVYGLTVNNVLFEDSAGHAVSLYGGASTKVTDIFITGSAINRSAVTGLLVGTNGADYDRKFCDSHGNFHDDPNLLAPRNIRIENSEFISNNTGAFGINTARWVAVRNNKFDDNYRNPQFGNIEGGTVFFDACTDTVEISGNAMRGPTYGQTQAMELWGRNITVKDNNVTKDGITGITGYANDGIELNSVYNAKVFNNNVHHNNTNLSSIGYEIGGIQIWTVSPGFCDQVPRDTQDVEVYNNISTHQAYGIGFGDRGSRSRNFLNGLNIYGNTLTPNTVTAVRRYNQFIVANGPVQPAPDPDSIEPVHSPRALGVDAVSPLTSICKQPGASRQTFAFSGADTAGAGNVDSIQGYLSIQETAGLAPTGAGCHFIYFPAPLNQIYLDGPNGGNTWSGGSSVVGPGGSSLSNGICTIHAGSTESVATTSGLISTVRVDIAFPQSSISSLQKRIYGSTQNKDGFVSRETIRVGNQDITTNWSHYGWWATQ